MTLVGAAYAAATTALFPALACVAARARRVSRVFVYPVVRPEDVPLFMVVLIGTEDRRFYLHQGVDWASALSAALLNIRKRGVRRGASTLTQQVVKAMYFGGRTRSWWDKLASMAAAILFERIHGKRGVLLAYLNLVAWGPWQGLRMASGAYFGKAPEELRGAEVVCLVAALWGPTLTQRRPDLWSVRQERILRKFGILGGPLLPEVPMTDDWDR